MEDEIPGGESLSMSRNKRNFLDRIFDSYLDDLVLCISRYKEFQIDQENLLDMLGWQLKLLHDLSRKGRLQKVLDKAEMVILDGVLKDLGT